MSSSYDCDPGKAARNLQQHGVSFDEGFAVLQATSALCLDLVDEREDYGEDRMVRIGPFPGIPSLLLHVPGPIGMGVRA